MKEFVVTVLGLVLEHPPRGHLAVAHLKEALWEVKPTPNKLS